MAAAQSLFPILIGEYQAFGMEHYWSLEGVQLDNAALTIGSFDGVHRGHQEIIKQLTTAGARQEGSPTVVLTFYPHPAVVLGKRQTSFFLTSPEERAALLGEMGIDYVVTHPFNRILAGYSAAEFMTYLKRRLGVRRLLVGSDFALGHGREGNVARLEELGESLGYRVSVLAPFEVDGRVVSSSWVRNELNEGAVEQAARLLGRPYRLRGFVVPGDGRGRTIGIPTANLSVWSERALPKSGVYVCRARVKRQVYGAVINVGLRPTFESGAVAPRVEAHLLDYEGDLYGHRMQLDFLSWVRDEQRFPSIQALVDQIHHDIQYSRQVLAAQPAR